ncbi:hypothetical protein C345_00850 [Cryptococcus neoformans A2-102-5]|nr:hypothetical protein C346_01165 [Cryptococcus neoformans var. grubii D17-1]OXG99051.1 hypothetical protein C345_00850 [Cryptococcus neoformans var. grubii A2-102-5]
MPFLRKSTISKKESLNSGDSPRAPSSKTDTPPRMRDVSNSSTIDDGTSSTDKHKRRHTLLGSKGRKKLSSLFSSSSSLSSYTEREGTASPKNGRSKLNVSSTSSGTSTPSRSTQLGDATDAQKALNQLSIGTAGDQLTESPESSPVVTTDEAARRQRRDSLWSQWELEGAGESSDEDDAFLTPSEGLSEVEEEDEEENEPSTAPRGISQPSNEAAVVDVASATPGPLFSPTDVKTEPTNVAKGSVASGGDIAGTGTSTIHRRLPSTAETKVKRHMSHNRPDATTVDQAAVLGHDIETCREAIRLFLTSRMKEAEEFCEESESEGHHLYLQSAMGIIEALKGMMTFDSVDLHNALEICKSTAVTASSLRRPSDNVFSRLGGMVKSHGGLARVKAMTPLERHAELVYAEQSLMKAMLAIISGGDWIGLVREAFNMRTAHGIYRNLQHFLEDADKHGYDDDIDMDFRSGVLLGTGTSSLMLSLLPGKVLKIAEVFGYAGDRKIALATLMAAGGWSHDSPEPAFDEKNEGLRRPVCDLILLTFHLVISVLIPITGVDVPLAKNILAYNMKRYPNGVFFLYFQARLHTTQCQPAEANNSLQRALDLKLEYIQLQHMCLWDYACNYMMLGKWKGALDCFSILKDESNWSRAVYTYAAAACIVELVEDGDQDAKMSEADKLMQQIPKLTKKIAGKSLPIEKFASRKARKFSSQSSRLFLPALELAYVFGSLSNTPRRSLLDIHVPRLNEMMKKLENGEENYGNGTGKEYWDDYVLAHFLRGMCQFVARYQPLDAEPSTLVVLPTDPSDHDLDQAAEKDFKAVIRHTPDVQLDHWILFHCYYELGRLYARRGDDDQAKYHFEVVMSGKLPDHNAYMAKAAGKYSLEGALLLKTHAALSAVKEREKERSGKR